MTHSLTSASNLSRRFLCAGSERMEKACPEDRESDAALEGVALHAVLAGTHKPERLSEDQAWCLDFCKAETDKLLTLLFGEDAASAKIHREVEMSLRDSRLTGHADFVAVVGSKGCVIDYKMGRGRVEVASANMQTRAYAVMMSERFFCSEVLAAIIQPRADEGTKVTIAQYSIGDIQQAESEIRLALLKCEEPDAPLVASLDACRYCRANASCPAAQKTVVDLVPVHASEITSTKAMGDLLRSARLAKKVIESIEFHAKTMALKGNIPEGFTIEEGRTVRKVTDAQKAYQALSETMLAEDFSACCTVKIGELDTAFRKSSGLKGKAAKEELEKILTGVGAFEIKKGDAQLVETP